MQRRARRAVIGAAALVAFVVAVLIATHWATVRDHVEAWHFQLSTERVGVFEPFFGFKGKLLTDRPGTLVQELADSSGCPVLFDAAYYRQWFRTSPSEPVPPVKRIVGATGHVNCVAEIEAWGWRVLKQRFPRRAYVRILAEHEGRNRRTR